MEHKTWNKLILVGISIILVGLEIYSLTTDSHYKWDFIFLMLLLVGVYVLGERIKLHPFHYLLFGMFFFATTGRVNSKEVKQQVVEKELALLISSAKPGMSFSVNKINMNGVISKIELKEGKVYAYVGGSGFSNGYSYFSKYEVSVFEEDDKFVVRVRG